MIYDTSCRLEDWPSVEDIGRPEGEARHVAVWDAWNEASAALASPSRLLGCLWLAVGALGLVALVFAYL